MIEHRAHRASLAQQSRRSSQFTLDGQPGLAVGLAPGMTKAFTLGLVSQARVLQMARGVRGSASRAGADELARQAVRIGKPMLGDYEALTREPAVEPTLVAARGGRAAEAQQQLGRQALAQARRAQQPLEGVDAQHARGELG